MEENYNIDGLFREGLNEYAEQAPASVWERVESDLKKSNAKPVIPLFIKLAAAVALLIGITGITYVFTLKDKNTVAPIQAEELVSPKSNIPQRSTNELARAKGKEFKKEMDWTEAQFSQSLAEGSIVNKSAELLAQNSQSLSQYYIQRIEPLDFYIPSNSAESFDLRIEVPADEVYSDFILQQNILAMEAAEEERKQEVDNVWSIGGQAGPQYSYRDASINPSGAEQFTNYDNFEEGIVAFAGGVNLEMQPKKRWSFQSGVHCSKIGVESSNIILSSIGSVPGTENLLLADANNGLEVPSTTGELSFDDNQRKIFSQNTEVAYTNSINYLPGTVKIEQNFEFIEIPLIVKYRIIDKKFGVNVSGGLWTNFLVGNNATASDDNGFYEEGATNNINTVNYIGSVGLGFNYPVSPKFLVTLDPLFKYYLSPLNNDSETEAHPYSFGLMTGVSFYF